MLQADRTSRISCTKTPWWRAKQVYRMYYDADDTNAASCGRAKHTIKWGSWDTFLGFCPIPRDICVCSFARTLVICKRQACKSDLYSICLNHHGFLLIGKGSYPSTNVLSIVAALFYSQFSFEEPYCPRRNIVIIWDAFYAKVITTRNAGSPAQSSETRQLLVVQARPLSAPNQNVVCLHHCYLRRSRWRTGQMCIAPSNICMPYLVHLVQQKNSEHESVDMASAPMGKRHVPIHILSVYRVTVKTLVSDPNTCCMIKRRTNLVIRIVIVSWSV